MENMEAIKDSSDAKIKLLNFATRQTFYFHRLEGKLFMGKDFRSFSSIICGYLVGWYKMTTSF
jgi:hypothetical protein